LSSESSHFLPGCLISAEQCRVSSHQGLVWCMAIIPEYKKVSAPAQIKLQPAVQPVHVEA